jgi:polyribonucleotide nucleotidyltransferase
MVAATFDNIMMVEGEMEEVSEEDMLDAIKVAHEAIKIQCTAQEELAALVGKTKRTYCHEINDADLKAKVLEDLYPACYALATQRLNDKHLRMEGFRNIVEEYIAEYKEANAENTEIDLGTNIKLIKKYYHDVEKEAMRRMILDEGIRLDGRSTTQIRAIWGEVDYLPGSHGSAIFTRGETQSLS